jgi:diguanylate cyclase
MNAPIQKSFFQKFGLGRNAPTAAHAETLVNSTDKPVDSSTLGDAARCELLSRISDFLLEQRLPITDSNLQAARAIFSGGNPALGRKITAMGLKGEKITQEWLDEALISDRENSTGKDEYDQILARLQTGLEVFTAVTKSARSVHGDYRSALEIQVGKMEKFDATGIALSSLADVTKAMLERTRQVEMDMRLIEKEASTLRKSLARAQRDAEIDHLTGLPNRRAFEGVLEREYREAQAAIEPLSVAFCDIDHFKRVNDTFGHETGDRVIQAIAQVLARISNEKCHVARHGGEEFVVLFRGMTRSEAKARLDGAREQLAARNFLNRKTDEPIGEITFSAGIADVFAYRDHRSALQAADEALYRAKEEGRNRILLA